MAMSISKSVGLGGVNNADDVRTVQILLNCAHRIVGIPRAAIVVDGLNGPRTQGAIQEFQRDVVRGVVDSRVDPNGATINKLNAIAPTLEMTVVQQGDPLTKHPYTIAIVANPALETPSGGGVFIPDPIMLNHAAFLTTAKYTVDVLFGRLPGQKENILADATIGPKIRIVQVFLAGLPVNDANALVGHYSTTITEPRRAKFVDFLATFGIVADVAYAITASATHDRAAAWYTTDDPSRGKVSYTLDGATKQTSLFCSIPGTVALHIKSDSLTGLHEFGHAFSSFTEGALTDQYNDSDPDFNVKRGRPIPANFSTFEGTTFASDPVRDGLGYPPTWQSYHPALTDPTVPSLMDNYYQAPLPKKPVDCRFDTLSLAFIRHRLAVKMSRS